MFVILGFFVAAFSQVLPSAGSPGFRQEGGGDRPVLADLVAEALRVNPDLVSLRERLEAMRHRVGPARALPDPSAGVAFLNAPISSNPVDLYAEPMTQIQFSYAQMFPAPGVRRLRGESAEWDVEAARESARGREVFIGAAVSREFYRLQWLDRNIEISGKNIEILEDMAESARNRYAVGEAELQSVAKAGVALGRLRSAVMSFEQMRSSTKSVINVLLNRDVAFELGDPQAELSASKTKLDFDALIEIAVENNPTLKQINAEIERSAVGVALAEKMLNPDYTLRFAYGMRWNRTDFWTAGVSFELPFWRGGKQREVVAEKEALLRVDGARLQAGRNAVALAIRTALDKIELADRQLALYVEELIPQAELALQSSLASYKVDRVDIGDVLENQMTLFALQLEYQKILFERESQVVELQTAVGLIPGLEQAPNTTALRITTENESTELLEAGHVKK